MTITENLDIYDMIQNPATKEKYFIKNVYPFYLSYIYKYNLETFKTRDVDKDMEGYILLRLIYFQMNRKNYVVTNYVGYIKKIIKNAVNDYLRKEIPYNDSVVLFSDLDY